MHMVWGSATLSYSPSGVADVNLSRRLGAAASALATWLRDADISTTHALVHPGWVAQLRNAVWQQCNNTEAAGELHIAVLGGSMTVGSMNCHSQAKIICRGKFQPKSLAWSNLLQSELQAVMRPSCRVVVHNRATPANRADILLSSARRDRLISPRDDLIIADFTVNDNKGIPRASVQSTGRKIAAGLELAIRDARSRRTAPAAFIFMEAKKPWYQLLEPNSSACAASSRLENRSDVEA